MSGLTDLRRARSPGCTERTARRCCVPPMAPIVPDLLEAGGDDPGEVAGLVLRNAMPGVVRERASRVARAGERESGLPSAVMQIGAWSTPMNLIVGLALGGLAGRSGRA